MKKRFGALLLIIAIILGCIGTLSSCGEKYKPVKSSKEEKATAITISYEKEKYKVPYELYRAFFLQYKSLVDGGDESVWTGADKEKYEKTLDDMIYKSLSEIYAVFHLCEKADINVYSRKFDKEVTASIEAIIDGSSISGGFDGDFDKYLLSLKEMNHNYSTAEIMIRYQLARQSLIEYYIGTTDIDISTTDVKDGEIKYTKNDVRAFYFDENQSRCIIRIDFPSHLTKEAAEAKRNDIAATVATPGVTLSQIEIKIANSTTANPESEVMGIYTNDASYYSELTSVAFSLKVGELSEIFEMSTNDFSGYTALYRLPTSEEYFAANYENIAVSFVLNEFGKTVAAASDAIAKVMTPTDVIKELDRSKVSMN